MADEVLTNITCLPASNARPPQFTPPPLMRRDHRRSSVAGEREDQALLGGLDDGRGGFPAELHLSQGRLGRDVIVPDVVVGCLEAPANLPVATSSATTELALPPAPGRAAGSGDYAIELGEVEAPLSRRFREALAILRP